MKNYCEEKTGMVFLKEILMMPVMGLAMSFLPVQAAEQASFTEKATAAKEGDIEKIHFAVSRETDAAVYILDKNGNIIRHLAAGVLGDNPPEPFRPNSLSQSIIWDGKADQPEGQS